MKRFILLLILLPFLLVAQHKSVLNRNYSDTLPKQYMLDIDKVRDYMYTSIPDKYKNNYFGRYTYAFTEDASVKVHDIVSGGWICTDWKEMENYINDILKKILPEELKNDTAIHAYIVKNGILNAYMSATGHLFVNIGIFSDVFDESMIAGILAHELAHYYLRHDLIKYLDIKTGAFNVGFNPAARYNYVVEYSVRDELQADAQAMRWIKNSGYSLLGIKKNFEVLIRIDKNFINTLKYADKLGFTTHPTSQQRLAKFNEFYKNNNKAEGKLFLVNEEKFKRLKEEAKPEILNNLLSDFNYSDCLEKAFKFHLFDPDNKTYVYYLMESIRRKCYLDPTMWDEKFIINRYYDSIKVFKYAPKQKLKGNIFSKFNPSLLSLHHDEADKINAKFYWEGHPKFTTYEEAFEFFYKLSTRLEENECILSFAMGFFEDTVSMNKYLRLYISKQDIKHRLFAENMLRKTCYSDLKNKKLIVFNRFNAYVRQKQINVTIRKHCPKIKDEVSCIIDTIMNNNSNSKPLYLTGFKDEHLNDYRLLSDLQYLTFKSIYSKNEKIELHMLDPDFWELFNKYNVNEFLFFNWSYTTKHRGEKSLEEFKNATNLDYNNIFTSIHGPKFLSTYISGVREIKDKYLKYNYFGGRKRLKAKKPAYHQIVEEVRNQLYHYS